MSNPQAMSTQSLSTRRSVGSWNARKVPARVRAKTGRYGLVVVPVLVRLAERTASKAVVRRKVCDR